MTAGGRAAARVALGAVCALLVARAAAPAAHATPPAADGADYAVVQYAGGVSAQGAGGPAPSLREQGFRTLMVPRGKTRAQFLAELRNDPGVLSAEADAPVQAATLPNDPYYQANQASYMAQINAPAAWELSTGRPTVVVAMIDSGTDLTHEEFAGRLWENSRDTTTDGIDDDANGCVDDRYGCRFIDLTPTRAKGCGYTSSQRTGAVLDDHGTPGALNHSHGTIVAGIVAAAGNNGKGITGVAWDVKLMTVKVLDCGPFGAAPRGEMSSVAEAIDYARRMGANIISLSLASEPGDQSADIAPLRKAIQDAQDQGVIIVAAAGNHSPGASQVGPGYPAAYTQFTNLVAVGASDQNGQWATFSNYGPALDFAAPGVGIVSTVRSDLGLANPYGVAVDGGTSFATPIVTGMFALMEARNSRLLAADYIQVARNAATPAAAAPHGQNWAGAGIVNIGAAVARMPMTITGSALKDWKDLPAGTELRAVVGTTECGTTLTTAFGPLSRFGLRVRSEAEQPGCGAPGKTVQVIVGGSPGVPTFPWANRNEDLGLASRDITTVSPPPGPVVTQVLNGGWSNVAHLDASGALPTALAAFAASWTEVLRWDPAKPLLDAETGAWRRFVKGVPAYVNDLPDLQRYDAYWVDGSAGNAATINPNPAPGRTMDLQPGWNNFVYTGSARSVADALATLDGKYSQVLQYDNATSSWLSYLPGRARYLNDFGGLFKLKVYWVLMTAPATLTMQ